MKNKNELTIKKYEDEKKIGKFLIFIGVGLIILSIIITILKLIGMNNSIVNISNHGIFSSFFNFLYIILLNTAGIGILILGIIMILKNNKRIKEDVIPKAKETLDKIEPVVTDVIKTVGEGIERTAEEVKESVKKNKKGE